MDHQNLIALQTPRKLLPKHVRWAEYFQRFNFVLRYVLVGRNFLANALSRMPQFNSKRDDVVQALVPGEEISDTVAWNMEAVTGGGGVPWLCTNHHLVTQQNRLM